MTTAEQRGNGDLQEGLKQSARGETEYLGSFAQYAGRDKGLNARLARGFACLIAWWVITMYRFEKGNQ